MDAAGLTRVLSSCHTCSSFQSSFCGTGVARAVPLRVAQRRNIAQKVRASTVAEPATLDVKSIKGQTVGTESLSLKVADSNVARGLLHRYIVLIRQNAREVIPGLPLMLTAVLDFVQIVGTSLLAIDLRAHSLRVPRKEVRLSGLSL
jgi:hypothetical protein